LSSKSEKEVKFLKDLKRQLRKEGYSDKAVQEICKWYE